MSIQIFFVGNMVNMTCLLLNKPFFFGFEKGSCITKFRGRDLNIVNDASSKLTCMLIKPHSNEIKNCLEAWLMLIVFNLRSNYLTIILLQYKCFCNHERSYQSIWKKNISYPLPNYVD